VQQEIIPIRYATRQPILGADESVLGYKLLFRTDVASHFSGLQEEEGSQAAIDMSSMIGLDTLCDNRLAFIGCDRDTLVNNSLAFLPSQKVVVELAQDLVVDSSVYEACCDLKNAGYRIALDDFTRDDPRQSLLHLADFLKFDIRRKGWQEIVTLFRTEHWESTDLIAEQVESREEFDVARRAGFQFFQGSFFRKPESMRARSALTNRGVYLRLLRAVTDPEFSWDEVEELIKSDAALYYRMLRFVNSAAFPVRCEVKSIRQALMLLGDDDVRRWCRLAGMFEMCQGKRSELILTALVRARFCELIGDRFDHHDVDLFLLGMLSLMDAILEIPMSAVIDGLPVDEESRDLLLEHRGELHPLYDLIAALEGGAWDGVVGSCVLLGLNEADAAECYSSAIHWAQTLAAVA